MGVIWVQKRSQRFLRTRVCSCALSSYRIFVKGMYGAMTGTPIHTNTGFTNYRIQQNTAKKDMR